jgi:hypothetical protein
VQTAVPATRVPMAARTAARTVALMALLPGARTAVLTVVPTAARTVRPDRRPDLAGPGGALAPSGPAAVHEPRPRGLRRPVLVAAAAADPGRGHRQLLHRPARPPDGRRAALPARPAHTLPAHREGRGRRRPEAVHDLRGRRRGDRRPGLLRRRPAAVRRRQHRRPAGAAPALAAADRVRRRTRRGPGPPDAGQRLHHATVLPRLQPALRRPRRLRAAGRR